MMRRALTPTELVVLVAILAFVVAPLATDLMELVMKSTQQGLIQTAWSPCALVLSAAWNMLSTVLFLWAPIVFCVAILVVCF